MARANTACRLRRAGVGRRGISPWATSIHLLWSVWLLIVPLFNDGYTLRWVLITLVSYPVFVLLFFAGQFSARRVVHRYALGLLALGLLSAAWYPGETYLIYGCVMLGQRPMRLPVYLGSLLLANALLAGVTAAAGYPWQALVSVCGVATVLGVSAYIGANNRRHDAALRLSRDEVRRLAATAERERIGRDLHDLLGHTLSLITLKLELSRRLFDHDLDRARDEIVAAEDVARQALSEVRDAVTGFRATGLTAELATARLMLETAGVAMTYSKLPSSLPKAVDEALALALREAVTNISRHAAAAQVRVDLVARGREVEMIIGDDGRGGIGAWGSGLTGMHKRLVAVGGRLAVESPPGRGTTLRLSAPIADHCPAALTDFDGRFDRADSPPITASTRPRAL